MDENENNEDQETTAPQQQESSGNEEAKRYRLRLREVERERDQLKEQVQSFRQAEVERRAADVLEDASDIWLTDVQVDHLLDENSGELDDEKLSAAVEQVADEHPGWRKRPQGVDNDQGRRSDNEVVSPSWAGMLRSPSRG